MCKSVQLLHLHTKPLHELHSHVHIGLRHQLILDDDLNAFTACGQGGGHQQRCQVLAGYRPTQLDLLTRMGRPVGRGGGGGGDGG